MTPISDILEKIKEKVKKTLWTLGLHAFEFILLLIFIDFIFGGFIFYKYVFLAEREESKITESVLKFNDNAYQKVLGELQTREKNNQQLLVPTQPELPK